MAFANVLNSLLTLDGRRDAPPQGMSSSGYRNALGQWSMGPAQMEAWAQAVMADPEGALGMGGAQPAAAAMPPLAQADPVSAAMGAPVRGKRGFDFWDTVGQVSDIVSTARGAPVSYAPAKAARDRKEREIASREALSQWLANPENDAAFTRYAASIDDPADALRLRSSQADLAGKRLDRAQQLDTYAMQLLGAAGDQAAYDRAREIVTRLYEREGMDAAAIGLPEEFSPEVLRELRLRGIDTGDQLQSDRLDRRLNWDIEDDTTDNERAMMLADDLMGNRAARLDETRRYHDLSDAARRRGQTLTDARVRRGQDLTDSRAGRSRGGSTQRGGENLPVMRTPEEAMKLPSGTRFRTPDGQIKVRP